MKRGLTSTLIFAHLLVYVFPLQILAQHEKLNVVKIQGNRFAANGGSLKGVEVGMVYSVHHNQKEIGQAKVVAVRENYCALQMVENNLISYVHANDQLILCKDTTKDADALLQSVSREEFSVNRMGMNSSRNYYNEGGHMAEMEYSGGGARAGGMAAGFLLGLIGWGFGYVMINSSNPQVPPQYLLHLNSQQQYEFRSGYQEMVIKQRKKNFSSGAVFGIIAAVVFVVSMNKNTNN